MTGHLPLFLSDPTSTSAALGLLPAGGSITTPLTEVHPNLLGPSVV